MGRDIYMHIVESGCVLKRDIFDGRCSAWFDNLTDYGWDSCYDHLPVKYDLSPESPEELKKEYSEENGYYDFRYIKVSDFLNWFEKYRPDIEAGWVTTYEKWLIEKKGYVPEDVKHYLDKDDDIRDMHFVEFKKPYDCSKWLYYYLKDNEIPLQADITYCFDW